jgi:hypothetical protein
MKLLVATKQGQGKRANDFFWANEGEIVRFGMECDGEEVDGGCGCRRALSGITTAKGTTTMEVAELPIDAKDLTNLMVVSLKLGGWDALVDQAQGLAQEMLAAAEPFPVGAIVERRGDEIQIRFNPGIKFPKER